MAGNILITGGTGILGKELCRILTASGISFEVAGRNNRSSLSNFRKLDLETGEGIDASLEGIETVFHLASATGNYNHRVDIGGTEMLISKAREKNIRHFIFISIVGTDEVPLKYYRIKREAEQLIRQNFDRHSILRATQFHELIDKLFHGTNKYPFLFLPKEWKVQPIEPKVVAEKLFDIFNHGPSRNIENIGGKEILTTQQLIYDWRNARGLKKKIIFIPLPGKASIALKNGKLTTKESSHESITWREWLAKKYPEQVNL